VASLLAATVTVVAFVYGGKVAGGSDSWGYLSQAEFWLAGKLPFMDLSFTKATPLQNPPRLFAPLAWEQDRHWTFFRAAPVTAPGYPLLVAAAKFVGGESNKFWVVPLLTGVLVMATFGLGYRMASPAAGLIAAWLVATSPAVLSMSIQAMSDVPVAGAWAAALFLLLGESPASALGAGLMTGLAVMIRPNHLPLVAVTGLYYVADVFSSSTRRRALWHGGLFSGGALVGILATAAINDALYRSPWRSGYGDLGRLFSSAYVWPNMKNYVGWLVESQTPIVLAGLVALCLPLRQLWPSLRHRGAVPVAALFVATLWSIYFFYEVFGAWWYLRFLLGSWPFIMVGTGAAIAWIMHRAGRAASVVIAVLLVGLGGYEVVLTKRYQAFELWRHERRYIRAGQMVARLTEPNSVILSGQHSGSLRYYGGRVTMRVDRTDSKEVDDMVRWLKDRDAHLYLAIEDWERPDIEARWQSSQVLDAIKAPPVAVYRERNEFFLFALSDPRTSGQEPEIVTGVDEGLTVPGPAPTPWLYFGEPGGLRTQN